MSTDPKQILILGGGFAGVYTAGCLEEGDVADDAELRRQLLTFGVGGGGFAGVEVMAELNDFVQSVKRNYLRLGNEPHRCVIGQAGDRLLPEMSATLALFAQKILRRRGVEIILNDRLAAATSEQAILQSGIEIPCKTRISTVRSALPSIIQSLDCPKERGKLLVNTGLELKDYEGRVWAWVTAPASKPSPAQWFRGRPSMPFAGPLPPPPILRPPCAAAGGRNSDSRVLGTVGSVGHGAAVAQIFGIKVSGLLAWLLWRYIYLTKMPGLNREVRIATDWLLHLLFPPELAQTRLAAEGGVRNHYFEPGDITFERGDLGDSVSVIEEGECAVLCKRKGEQQLLATLSAGACRLSEASSPFGPG